jgi:hypothetical protein
MLKEASKHRNEKDGGIGERVGGEKIPIISNKDILRHK